MLSFEGSRNDEIVPSVMLLPAWIVVCDDSPGEEKPATFVQLAARLGAGVVRLPGGFSEVVSAIMEGSAIKCTYKRF